MSNKTENKQGIKENKKIGTVNVMELFAGVGGFRLGLEKANKQLFNTVFANQWEPSKKTQFAFNCYDSNFSEGLKSNEDIATINVSDLEETDTQLIVGGFPCQDYSVSQTAKNSKGLEGKKGVLFWEIVRLTKELDPKYLLLENVDRLLISPSKQRGRDFAIMLAAFRDLGYFVEWRVINAAEYGNATKRKRVFIFAVKKETEQAKLYSDNPSDLIYKRGFFAPSFPVKVPLFTKKVSKIELDNDILTVSNHFNGNFLNAGVMLDGEIYTDKVESNKEAFVPLKDILEENVDDKYYLTKEKEDRFKYLRGSKRFERETKDGHKYIYTEGKMRETDDLALPSRTILTSEGNVSRTTHVIDDAKGKRYLTPKECERIMGFPDNWTNMLTDRQRYFVLGNALVVGLVERMGKRIEELEMKTQL